MNEKRDEKWLDELISRSINTKKPQFDVEKWKQKYPEEFGILKSRAGQASPRQHPILTYGVNYHTCKRVGRTIFKSPITKLAAAAVIIIAVGLFLVHRGPDEQIKPTEVAKVTKSPAEMMTMASLTFAYRRGGIEAVEEICDKAFKMVGPRPASLSVRQLLEELNGNGKNSERTKL